MSILTSLFNSERAKAWRLFASDIGAIYEERTLLRRDKVRLRYKNWEIVMDKHEVGDGENNEVYTRLSVDYVSQNDFHFRLRTKSFFGRVATFLGMTDIDIGEPGFDRAYRIESNDEVKVKEFFSDANFRALIDSKGVIGFNITDLAGTAQRVFLSEIAKLNYLRYGVIMDKATLRKMFNIIKVALDRLVMLDIAHDADPTIRTKGI